MGMVRPSKSKTDRRRPSRRDLQPDEGGTVMARVIAFYVPENFRRKVTTVPPAQPGKVIAFCMRKKTVGGNPASKAPPPQIEQPGCESGLFSLVENLISRV